MPEIPPVVAAALFPAAPPVLPSVPGGGIGGVFASSWGVEERRAFVAGLAGVCAPGLGRASVDVLSGAGAVPMDGAVVVPPDDDPKPDEAPVPVEAPVLLEEDPVPPPPELEPPPDEPPDDP